MTRSVSIVVPCRNEAQAIRPFLDSVLQQDWDDLEWEVLVADGCSTDGTRGILDEYCRQHPRVRVLDNPGKIAATGLNAAIRAAHGEVIIRMDCHTEYQDDYVRQCVLELERTGADNVGGAARTRAVSFRERLMAAAYHHPFTCGGARFHDPEYEGPVDTVTYGCWRRSTFDRVGLFDESLVRNQDDEHNLRLSRAGGGIWQSARIVSWYHPRTELRNLFRQYRQYGFWKVAVIRKHRIPASWRHLVPGAFVFALASLPVAALLAWLLGSLLAALMLLSVWAAVIGLYLAASIAAAASVLREHGWRICALLPIVFTTYHIAYGVGFVSGLCYWSWPSHSGRPTPPERFAALSR